MTDFANPTGGRGSPPLVWWKLALRITRITIGLVLILAGLAGLVLPLVPGWLMIIPGFLLLGSDSRLGRWIHELLHRLVAKSPRLQALLHRHGIRRPPPPAASDAEPPEPSHYDHQNP